MGANTGVNDPGRTPYRRINNGMAPKETYDGLRRWQRHPCPKGTPGAIKQQIESEKWYGCWKDGGNKVMVPLATDKQASQAMLTDIIRHRERGEAGLVNPYKPHLDRAVAASPCGYVGFLLCFNAR